MRQCAVVGCHQLIGVIRYAISLDPKTVLVGIVRRNGVAAEIAKPLNLASFYGKVDMCPLNDLRLSRKIRGEETRLTDKILPVCHCEVDGVVPVSGRSRALGVPLVGVLGVQNLAVKQGQRLRRSGLTIKIDVPGFRGDRHGIFGRNAPPIGLNFNRVRHRCHLVRLKCCVKRPPHRSRHAQSMRREAPRPSP